MILTASIKIPTHSGKNESAAEATQIARARPRTSPRQKSEENRQFDSVFSSLPKIFHLKINDFLKFEMKQRRRRQR